MPPNVQVTTRLVLNCTGILVLTDVVLVLMAWKTILREQFSGMRWLLAISGSVFFLLVWTSAMLWGWEWFYSYEFSGWAR